MRIFSGLGCHLIHIKRLAYSVDATLNDEMKLNLDSLLAEIESYLESHGIIVFHSHPRAADTSAPVYWDTDRYPDYKKFLAAAEAAGAKLVAIHAREFNADILEDALDHAASANLPREERRAIELRLKEMG